jgi:hypothetical protein
MFGAIKPPWISKKDFYRTPFNYCDRWCDRCHFTKICRVFLEEQKAREKWIKQGKDPDSWEFTFHMVSESFKKTRKMLEKDAKRFGIDLDNLNDADYEPPPKPETFPLYKLTIRFTKKIEKLMKDLEEIPIDADKALVLNNRAVLSHYMFLVPAKTYRALTSKIEEEKDEDDFTMDAKTSAFIAINSLLATAEALKNLACHKPLKATKIKYLKLGKLALNLADTLNLEFNLNVI